MTAGAPWSVKGIDPKAREIAKDLARRSGMTLGEWLNRMIVEGEAPEPAASRESVPAPDEPVVIATPRADAEPRYELSGHPADEVGKVADAIAQLSERIEAAEQRSTLAITGIDQSVRGALARLEAAERDQVSVSARFEGAVDEVRTETGRVADRLRKLELESQGPRSAEALRALEGMLGKVAGQFYDSETRTRDAIGAVEARMFEVEKSAGEARDPGDIVEAVAARLAERLEQAEGRTTDALRDLGASFVALDRRLKAVEAGGGAARLEALAADLTRRMETTRSELAEKLASSAEARFDRMDRRLSEMASHVEAAEQRSAQAIERVGREMVSMADSLSRRVQGVENRGADAIEQVGGEVARIASVVEQRLGRADTAQAQALEKLGGEIARITERLAERIANSERRGALAIDEVGEQVARVTERINQRQERTASDLAERIRQSEERTARLLEEARERIDASLGAVQRRTIEPVAQPAPAPAPAPVRPAAAAPPPRAVSAFDDPFAAEPFPDQTRDIPDEAFAPQAFSATPAEAAPGEPAPFPADERGAPAFSPEDISAADAFAEIEEVSGVADEPDLEAEAGAEPFDVDEAPQPRSTREVIEQARLAARAAAGGGETRAPTQSQEMRNLFGMKAKKPKRRAGGALMTALYVAGGAATVGVLSLAAAISINSGDGKPTTRMAAMAKVDAADARGEVTTGEADTAPAGGEPDSGIDPEVAADAAATAPLAGAPAAEDAAGLYADGARRVAAGDNGGVDAIRKAANLGYAPAQYHLSKLFETGQAGLKKDAAEARRWTERAAQAGDRKAMHNLALYYFEGVGGPKNTTIASQWFRKAADMGMTDSQYNLGRLYEDGIGVAQNSAEAYKWYLIAARTGDAEARASAERVKPDLSREALAAAERTASTFRAAAPNPSTRAPSVADGGAVAGAQRALTMLGYYRGPQDGAASGALKGAIQAFQKDRGLPVTGELDDKTVSLLSTYAR